MILSLFLIVFINLFHDSSTIGKSSCKRISITSQTFQADVILSGSVERVFNTRNSPIFQADILVIRIFKGREKLPLTEKRITLQVGGFGNPDICKNTVRRDNTKILFLKIGPNGQFLLNSSVLQGSLMNFKSIEKAVKDQSTLTPSPCVDIDCDLYSSCHVRNGKAKCECPTCEGVPEKFVCGSDGITYPNECSLQATSCIGSRLITVNSEGNCILRDPCQSKICLMGSVCKVSVDNRSAKCVCPEICNKGKVVCGSDGKDYPSECHLNQKMCSSQQFISVKYQGQCNPCKEYSCSEGTVCQVNSKRDPVCSCKLQCMFGEEERSVAVCGSTGETFKSECRMRQQSCLRKIPIHVVLPFACEESKKDPCMKLSCAHNAVCARSLSSAECVCNVHCEPVYQPVCGQYLEGTETNLRTYDNYCLLKMEECRLQKYISKVLDDTCAIYFKESQKPCFDKKCQPGEVCVLKGNEAVCVCNMKCDLKMDLVCGTDNKTYMNECNLLKQSCLDDTNISVKYYKECPDPCRNVKCDWFKECKLDKFGIPFCACPESESCNSGPDWVCGNDSFNYQNECQMRRTSCLEMRVIKVAKRGLCDPCSSIQCKYFSTCSMGRCECAFSCNNVYGASPVCGDNGQIYENLCELKLESCTLRKSIAVTDMYSCKQYIDDQSAKEDRENQLYQECSRTCLFGSCVKQPPEEVVCRCPVCSNNLSKPVCGSDDNTYQSSCHLQARACQQNDTNLQYVHFGKCNTGKLECPSGTEIYRTVEDKKYHRCTANPDSCPYSSFCYNGICCAGINPRKSCVYSKFGCCRDGKTAALDKKGVLGCPEMCSCNLFGSYHNMCDASGQCLCRPGVGDLKCDRCLPGFWNYRQLLSNPSQGCQKCGCNYPNGTERQDCDQMTGKCSCKQDVMGDKCDKCPQNHVLIEIGCAALYYSKRTGPKYATQADDPSKFQYFTSCDHSKCGYGAECEWRGYYGICECNIPCETDSSNNLPFCADNGLTYTSFCKMKVDSCKLQKAISFASWGDCNQTLVNKSIDVCSSYTPCGKGGKCRPSEEPSLYHCDCNIGLTGKHCDEEQNFNVPSFNGYSYLILNSMEERINDEISLSFLPKSDDGLLIYAGDDDDYHKRQIDFFALYLYDGFLKFSFNVGGGTGTISSQTRMQLNEWQAVTLFRSGNRVRAVINENSENQQTLDGKAPGNLQFVNTKSQLFVGGIPTTRKYRITDQLGLQSGYHGCITKLKINKENLKLSYPLGTDVLAGVSVGECQSNPCDATTCENGGICLMVEDDTAKCHCPYGFQGDACELPVNACHRSPCVHGECEYFPESKDFVCHCSILHSGKFCEKEIIEFTNFVYLPEFSGNGFLKWNKTVDITDEMTFTIWFMPILPYGLILFNGQEKDMLGDFFAVVLTDGFVEFSFDLGHGPVFIRSQEKVKIGEWQEIIAVRSGNLGKLTLNGKSSSGSALGSLTQLNLGDNMYIGGYPNLGFPNNIKVNVGFYGVIEKLEINTVVLIGEKPLKELGSTFSEALNIKPYTLHTCQTSQPCGFNAQCLPVLDEYICRCPSKMLSKNCKQSLHEVSQRALRFDGATTFSYKNEIDTSQRKQVKNVIEFDLRIDTRYSVNRSDGIIMWTSFDATGDYLGITISGGYLQLIFNLGAGMHVHFSSMPIVDNRWHHVLITRENAHCSIQIDKGLVVSSSAPEAFHTLETSGFIWIGGAEHIPKEVPFKTSRGFIGCLKSFFINSRKLDLVRDALHAVKLHYCE